VRKSNTNVADKTERFNIDKRADQVAAFATDGDPDEALDTYQTAQLLGVSHQWLEIRRAKGGGPKFTRVAPRMVRYVRRDIVNWLNKRKHESTAEYMGG
jgi:hypothetical protein